MTKAVEIAAMTLGGLSLFAICFIGFAVMSGTPISEIAGIGELLEGPEIVKPLPTEGPDRPEAAPTGRSETEIVSAGIGVMGVWSMPAPYTKEELERLVDELKGKLTTLEMREEHLDERERQLDDQMEVLAERFESLERLRAELEEFGRELDLRELEVLRDEQALSERDAAKWKDVAGILADLDEETAGTRLVEYPPEQAAAILRAMTTEEANTVLNAVDPKRWKEYVDAYTSLRDE